MVGGTLQKTRGTENESKRGFHTLKTTFLELQIFRGHFLCICQSVNFEVPNRRFGGRKGWIWDPIAHIEGKKGLFVHVVEGRTRLVIICPGAIKGRAAYWYGAYRYAKWEPHFSQKQERTEHRGGCLSSPRGRSGPSTAGAV